MTAALLLAGAVLLVAFGGLMAAIDAAFGVTSRSDIEEMGAEGRNGPQLARIDPATATAAATVAATKTTATGHITAAAATTGCSTTSSSFGGSQWYCRRHGCTTDGARYAAAARHDGWPSAHANGKWTFYRPWDEL